MTVISEVPETTPHSEPVQSKPRAGGQRADIQALRAVAVGSVVLYHLMPQKITGGFVGVDVFFVVSGFLIGSHLLKESLSAGRIRLGRFWARRARRLLPASLLVLLVVAVATPFLVPLDARQDVWRQIVGSAFYVQNWVLAGDSVDYLAADDAPSPLQHFWTLSAEEQFYVLLPLVLLLVTWKARRRLVAITATLGVLTVASLAWSVHLTAVLAPAAYFNTFTRAWEFLLGTLLAAVLAGGLRLGPWVRTGLGWLGLVMILAAVVRYDGTVAFPGTAAALPVLGAVAVLAADGRGPLALAARWRPVTWLGDHSYALYLWHWPLIVLVPAATGHDLTVPEGAAVLVAGVVVAYLSTRLVEDPLRYASWLAAPARVGVAAAAAMVLVAAVALGGLWGTTHHIDRLEATAAVVAYQDHCLGAQAGSKGCTEGTRLVPSPSVASLDDWNPDACWGSDDSKVHLCHFGPAPDKATKRVLAVGDSHNNMYLAFYQHLALSRGWSVDVAGHAGCRWGMTPQHNSTPEGTRHCTAWKHNIDAMLTKQKPYDIVITSALRNGAGVAARRGQSKYDAGVADASRTWAKQVERGSVVVALRDTPRPRPDVTECVAEAAETSSDPDYVNAQCSKPASKAYADAKDVLPGAVAQTPGTALLSVGDLLCGDTICPAVIGDVVVYRDKDHITRTFVKTMLPQLGDRLDKAVAAAQARRTA